MPGEVRGANHEDCVEFGGGDGEVEPTTFKMPRAVKHKAAKDKKATTTGKETWRGCQQQPHPIHKDVSIVGSCVVVGGTDPNFAERSAMMPAAFIGDWRIVLAQENKDRMAKIRNNGGTITVFMTPKVCEFVLTVCNRLRLPHEVRFKALFIFNKFMVTQWEHTKKVLFAKKGLDDEQKRKYWDSTEANMARQLPMRLLACIQIASKERSYHESLGTLQVMAALRALGFVYTQETLLKSEMRVLRAIHFHVPKSPVENIETILKTAESGVRRITVKDVMDYWQNSLLILDVVFLHYDHIYFTLLRQVFTETTGESGDTGVERLDVEECKGDFILLAAAVLVVSVHVSRGPATAKKFVKHVVNACSAPMRDVCALSGVIMDTIRTQDERNRKHAAEGGLQREREKLKEQARQREAHMQHLIDARDRENERKRREQQEEKEHGEHGEQEQMDMEVESQEGQSQEMLQQFEEQGGMDAQNEQVMEQLRVEEEQEKQAAEEKEKESRRREVERERRHREMEGGHDSQHMDGERRRRAENGHFHHRDSKRHAVSRQPRERMHDGRHYGQREHKVYSQQRHGGGGGHHRGHYDGYDMDRERYQHRERDRRH